MATKWDAKQKKFVYDGKSTINAKSTNAGKAKNTSTKTPDWDSTLKSAYANAAKYDIGSTAGAVGGIQSTVDQNRYKPKGGAALGQSGVSGKAGGIYTGNQTYQQNLTKYGASAGLTQQQIDSLMSTSKDTSSAARSAQMNARARMGDASVLEEQQKYIDSLKAQGAQKGVFSLWDLITKGDAFANDTATGGYSNQKDINTAQSEYDEYKRLLRLSGAENTTANAGNMGTVGNSYEDMAAETRQLRKAEAYRNAGKTYTMQNPNSYADKLAAFKDYDSGKFDDDLRMVFGYDPEDPEMDRTAAEDAAKRLTAITGKDYAQYLNGNNIGHNWMAEDRPLYDKVRQELERDMQADGLLRDPAAESGVMSLDDYTSLVRSQEEEANAKDAAAERVKGFEEQAAKAGADVRRNPDYEEYAGYKRDYAYGTDLSQLDMGMLNGYTPVADGSISTDEYRAAVTDALLNEIVAGHLDEQQIANTQDMLPELGNYSLGALQYMTDDQRSDFFYLYNSGDHDAAKEYLRQIDFVVNKQRQDSMFDQYRQRLESGALEMAKGSVASVPENFMNQIVGFSTAARKAMGVWDPLTEHEYSEPTDWGKSAQLARGVTGEAIAEAMPWASIEGKNVFQMGYNAVMSSVDSFLNTAAFGHAASIPMGFGAFETSFNEGLESGKSESDAFIDALVDGGIEISTEYFSVEAFLKDATNPLGIFLQNMFTEGAEEVTGDIAKMGYDLIKNGVDNRINTRIKELERMGYTRQDAFKAATKEWLMDVAEDGITGSLSGGFAGGAASVRTHAANVEVGKTVQSNNAVQNLFDLTGSIDLSDASRKIVEQAKAHFEAGKVKPAEVGRVFREAANSLDAQSKAVVIDNMNGYVQDLLKGYGYDGDQTNTERMAGKILSLISGDTIKAGNALEVADIGRSDAALKAIDALTAKIADQTKLEATREQLMQTAMKGNVQQSAQQRDVEAEAVTDDTVPEVDSEGINSIVSEMQAAAEGLEGDEARQAQMDVLASSYGEGVADVVANSINPDQTPETYAVAFDQAYQWGQDGRNLSVISNSELLKGLTQSQIQTAYQLGKDARATENAQQQSQRMSRYGNVPVGKIDLGGIKLSSLNNHQMATVRAMRTLADAVGFNVRFVESMANEQGKYTTENGSFDPSTLTVTLDIHAGENNAEAQNYAIMHTAGHELTHFIKEMGNGQLWNDYQDFVMGHLSEQMDEAALDAEIKHQMALDERLDRDGAIEEIVANASGEALLNLSDTQIQQMAQENPNLLRRIANFVKGWIEDVKNKIAKAYKGTQNKQPVAKEMAAYLDEMSQRWGDLLVTASKNVRQQQAQGATVETSANAETSENAETSANAEETSASLEEIAESMEETSASTNTETAGEPIQLVHTHIDSRSYDSVRNEDTDLFSHEVEMAEIAYQEMAKIMLSDAENSIPGKKFFVNGNETVLGQNRGTTELIGRILDHEHWGWDKLKSVLQGFADGTPKNTVSSRVMELYLDEALSHGYTTIDGTKIAPSEEYVQTKAEYEGSMKDGMDVRVDADAVPFNEYAFDDVERYSPRDFEQADKTAEEGIDKWCQRVESMSDEEYSRTKQSTPLIMISEHTPAILQKYADAKNRKMLIRLDALYLAIRSDGVQEGHYHHLGAENMVDIVRQMDDPDAILDSDTGRRIVLVHVNTKKGQALASVEFEAIKDYNGRNEATNLIITAFDYEKRYLKGQFAKHGAKVLYEKETLSQVNPQLLEWLRTFNESASGDSIAQPDTDVKRSSRDTQTETPEFKRWFGDSKVVDEDGKPLVVYHGSDADFNAFDISKGRANMDIQGAFFSPYDDDARGYGGNVRAFYLSIKNPADERTAYRALNLYKGQNGAGVKAREYLIKQGYDGVYNGYDEYIAFYPAQIKSATDNVGTFDPKNPDIRYSVRDGKITEDSTEEERYEILKDAALRIASVDTEKLGKVDTNFNGMRMAERSKAIKTIAKTLGVHNVNLRNSSIEGTFMHSLSNVKESANKQQSYGGSYNDLVSALTCIDQLAEFAVPIEVHSDKKIGTKKANQDLKNVFVLVSGFADGNGIVPVQMEVKEFYEREAGLYLNVALKKIESDVVSPRRLSENQKGLTNLLSDSTISLAEIFQNVNPETDSRFLKYVPDGFLNDVQQAAKQKALRAQAEEYANYGKANADVKNQMRDPYAQSDREILASALMSAAANETELSWLKRYQAKAQDLSAKQAKLDELRTRISQLRKQPSSPSKTAGMKALRNAARDVENAIDRVDKRLLELEALAPLKEVMKRQRAESKAKMRDTMNERIKVERQKGIAKARKVRDTKNESAMKGKYKPRIQQDVAAMREWLTHPTNKAHVPEFLRAPLGDFLETLDFSSARALKGKSATQADLRLADKMDDLRRALAKARSDQTSFDGNKQAFMGYLDLPPEYIDEFDSLTKDIKDTIDNTPAGDPINKMTGKQLQALSRHISALNHAVRSMNTLLANAKYASVVTAAHDAMTFLEGLGDMKSHGKLSDAIRSFMDWKNATPYYVFKRFGKGGEGIFSGLQDGWDKLAFNVKQAIDYATSDITGYTTKEAREWAKQLHTYQLNGDDVQITTAQLMSLYCLNKRLQAVGHLLGGGIRIADITGIGKGGKTIHQANDYTLTEHDISAMIEMLTDRQRAVADSLQYFMNTTCAQWGNEVSMKRFGYEAFGEENYFPIRTDSNNRKAVDESARENDMFRLLNMSSTKAVVQNANNAIVLEDIFDVFSQHTTDMAKYNALALPILDTLKWYNFVERTNTEAGQVETATMQKSLEKAYGKDAQNYIREFIRDLNGTREGGRMDGTTNRLLSNYKVAAVAANLRVGFLQITSMPRAAYAINAKYLIKGAAKNVAFQNSRIVDDHVGIAQWKSMGFYDTNISRNVREMVKHTQTVGDTIKEKSMTLAEKGDAWTMGVLYGAVKAEMADKHPEVKPGTKVYEKRVNDRMREIVYQTQVVDSTMTRSSMMRGKGLGSLMTAFMSEPTLSINMLADSIYEQRMKARADKTGWRWILPSKKFGKAIAVHSIVVMFSSLFETLFTVYRDDDEFETKGEKFMDSLWSNLIDNINPLNNIPIVKDIYAALGGEKSSNMITDGYNNLRSGYDELVKYIKGESKNPWYNGVYKTLNGASQVSGFAASAALRDTVSFYNTFIADEIGKPRIQTYYNTPKEAATAIANAHLAGNKDMVDFYQKRATLYGIEGDKLESGMASYVKENYKDTKKITSAQAKDLLASYGGKSAAEADDQVDKWDYELETGLKYSEMKNDYISGDVNKATARKYMMKMDKAEGEKVDAKIDKWNYQKSTGFEYSDMGDDYKSGSLSTAQAKQSLMTYAGKTEEQAEQTISNWDYQAYTGKTEGQAPKYWKLAQVYETGGDYKAYAKQLMEEVMANEGGKKKKSWKQARSSIASSLASYYKKDYLAVKGTAKGDQMLEQILDIYEAIGYDRNAERKYINTKWLTD